MSFRTLDLQASDLSSHPDLLHQICRREVDLAIVRGAFPAAPLAAAAQQVAGRPDTFDWTPQEHRDPNVSQMVLAGESLTPYVGHPSGPDLEHYLRTAARFRTGCRELLGDFEGTLEALFRKLSGGREVSVPRYTDGRYYHPATIRWLPVGCRIPLHVGNYFTKTPAYAHLSSLISLEDQLSYFMPLAVAEGGGELVVYSLEWGDPALPKKADGRWDEAKVIATYPSESFAPGVGDLLVFNGGRYYHLVSTVEGNNPRCTIGGFLGFSRDMSQTFYWS